MLEELRAARPVGENAPPVKLWDGTILDTPASYDEDVRVALPGADNSRHFWGPCPWMPRGPHKPQVGDRCLVAFDDDGDPWVVVWDRDPENPDPLSTDDSIEAGGFETNANFALWVYNGSEGEARFSVRNTGMLQWGDGVSTRDTNLYRPVPNDLKTDNNFRAALDITARVGASSQISLQDDGGVGKIFLGPAGDASLFRDNAGRVNVGGPGHGAIIGASPHGTGYTEFRRDGAHGTNGYALLSAADGTTFVNASAGKDVRFREANIDRVRVPSNVDGFVFGVSGDTILYRAGSNHLRTDDDFEIGPGRHLFFYSPNGTRYRLLVSDGGVLSAAP